MRSLPVETLNLSLRALKRVRRVELVLRNHRATARTCFGTARTVVEAVLETEHDLALIYGVLHLPDLVARLEAEGFERTRREWRVAFSIDLEPHGLGPVHVDYLRRANARTIERMVESKAH